MAEQTVTSWCPLTLAEQVVTSVYPKQGAESYLIKIKQNAEVCSYK